MPEVRKQSFYIYEICDVANSDKTITKIKAKNNVGEYPVYAATINKPFAYINSVSYTHLMLPTKRIV